jgi:hypothetical protein
MHRRSPRSWLALTGLAMGLLGPAGCVQNTIELEDESSGADDEDGSTTSTTTTSTTTAGPTTNPGTTPTTADSGPDTDTAAGPGYCNLACLSLADCGSPQDWECIDGFCQYTAEFECDPAQCDDLGIGVCSVVDGISQCTFPCTPGGSECDNFGLVCTGVDDAGSPICAGLPCNGFSEGEPCEFEGLGAFGVCTDGECTCTSDLECTFDGFACDL